MPGSVPVLVAVARNDAVHARRSLDEDPVAGPGCHVSVAGEAPDAAAVFRRELHFRLGRDLLVRLPVLRAEDEEEDDGALERDGLRRVRPRGGGGALRYLPRRR